MGDSQCILKVTKILYGIIVEGNDELGIKRTEPLHKDVIEMNFSTLKYTLNDVDTHGFSLCSVESGE